MLESLLQYRLVQMTTICCLHGFGVVGVTVVVVGVEGVVGVVVVVEEVVVGCPLPEIDMTVALNLKQTRMVQRPAPFY
jgi:hypothetical protein